MAATRGEKIAWKSGVGMQTIFGPENIGLPGNEVSPSALFFICTNSFTVLRSKGIGEIYAYRRNENRWVYVGALSNEVSVNGFSSRNYVRPEIHYAISIGAYSSIRNLEFRMGTFRSMPQSTYDQLIRKKKIYGKSSTSISGAFKQAGSMRGDINAGMLSLICPDPFQTDWGDITSARGQSILASEEYRLVAYDFDSTTN